MKIVRLQNGEKETFGLVKGDSVSTKEEITYNTGVPLPLSIKDFLFDGWFDEVKDQLDNLPYAEKLSKFKILAPINNPPKILCLAFNYSDHAKEQNLSPPKDPVVVMKPRTALCGNEDEIKVPEFVTQLDYEVELAIIIGKNSKNITQAEAKDAIFGYTILNDVSARDIQFKDKQFTRAKSFDTFAPCGPWITTRDEISDPENLRLTTKVNGELRQNSSTQNMYIKPYEIVAKLSQSMTLEKGDIISTGTPSGVVLNNPDLEYLKDGDQIEMEIEKLGILKNSIKVIKNT